MDSGLPAALIEAISVLKNASQQPWDADEDMPESSVWASPLGQLIETYRTVEGEQAFKPVLWLAFYAARRALPCWSLYCDTHEPQSMIAALERLLKLGTVPEWSDFSCEPTPSFRDAPIVDCRECDTSCAAHAAYQSILFAKTKAFRHAVYAISAADSAFDQSPLGKADHFRKWLVDYAVPISYARREMSPLEQNALRDHEARSS